MSTFDSFAVAGGSNSGLQSSLQQSLGLNGVTNSLSELSQTYNNMGSKIAGITKPITDATNQSLQQNLSMGGQAATNAAKEYSAREAQAGGTGAGSGVVKAQALMGVLGQNSALKLQSANTVASLQKEGLSMQAQLAAQMAQLRQSYASTLANYVTQQNQQGIAAATAVLQNVHPTGTWATNNQGMVANDPSSQASYANYNNQMAQRSQASSFLAGIV